MNTFIGTLNGGCLTMGRGDDHPSLSAAFRESSHTAEQEWSTGHGFMMFVWNGQADKQIPPVVDQGHQAGHDLTGLQLSGDKATPAPADATGGGRDRLLLADCYQQATGGGVCERPLRTWGVTGGWRLPNHKPRPPTKPASQPVKLSAAAFLVQSRSLEQRSSGFSPPAEVQSSAGFR